MPDSILFFRSPAEFRVWLSDAATVDQDSSSVSALRCSRIRPGSMIQSLP
jgi:hypothetical protein